jgi:hypothetical protein
MVGGMLERARVCAALFMLCTLIVSRGPEGTSAYAQQTGRLYRETGKTLSPEFLDFYDRNGGILQFGYPITEARMEGGYLVQWTERQRLEYHTRSTGPQSGTECGVRAPEGVRGAECVLLGLLGRELTAGLEGPRFARTPDGTSPDPDARPRTTQEGSRSHHFPETGHTLAEPFLSYWQERGGLPIFGYPISQAYRDERGLLVQWFERVRMEYHPENGEHSVLLGHLGLESLRAAESERFELEVFGTAAPDYSLRIDLAQGGESDDPDFFANVVEQGRALGPGLLRIDNIYNFYDIVGRTPNGALTYNWTKLDRVLDNVRAMGREPLICLSYMPETMSLTGESRIEPPAKLEEWAALVEATVRHVNLERRMGVRYWEVWNEPDQIGFWRSGFPDYMRLYDATVKAALAADPSVKIGGPAVGRFSLGHLDDFLRHEAAMGVEGRVDFVSWHEYGRSPEELGSHIREVREVLAKFPAFQPELFITEFNVLQGGPNDTSAGGKTDRASGAIALLASIESMQRERLDRAFLFELKDGAGPKRYWGRWGILTHDGQPKPIYHTLRAFSRRPAGMLPVVLRRGSPDGRLGMMAYGGPERSTFFVWYTGEEQARVKVRLPAAFSKSLYTLTLFDETHNNPARTGDATLRPWMERDAGDLVFTLQKDSLVIIETR